MIINQAKWNEIVAVTEAEMVRWNENAKEQGIQDRHVFSVIDEEVSRLGRYFFLVTSHLTISGSQIDEVLKVAVRETATGRMWPAKAKRNKLGRIEYTLGGPEPKAWKTLADKPADTIVKKLGLGNFSFGWTVTTSGKPYESTPPSIRELS